MDEVLDQAEEEEEEVNVETTFLPCSRGDMSNFGWD